MASTPAIIWRNPKVVRQQRIWNEARHDSKNRTYIVVRSVCEEDAEWEGLPNLEVIEGGSPRRPKTNAGLKSHA
jgi:hypothetical protein